MQDLRRRDVLGAALALGASAALPGLPRPAAARRPTPGKLTDIDHVVIMMQENRSFDHYFGRFRGVDGFGARAARATFTQPDGAGGFFRPFHLDVRTTGGGCTADPIHFWGAQHQSVLTPGSWITSHAVFQGADAPVAMAYVDRRDIPYYWALAHGFTLCDRYFCSAMGPTDPNRSYAMTATIDPDGLAGGPLVSALGVTQPHYSWTTMPEQLQARGISWKVYSDPSSTFGDGDNPLLFFTQYRDDATLKALGIDTTFEDFFTDLAAGNLPQVSWITAPVGQLEHPLQSTPVRGEFSVARVVEALTSHPDIWAHTALFVTYDENGGYFDHVTPPTPPPGTAGEFLTVDPLPPFAFGVAGPIGLGPRVPMLVISPFSRGGFVSSDVFDHTSTLLFLETRFGAEVPNLTAWRRATVGDLTSAFNFAAPDPSIPKLPGVPTPDGDGSCSNRLADYPRLRRLPAQPRGRARRPSGPVAS